MNILAQVKLSNNYDLIVRELPDDHDVEGMTALLLNDGTSYEFLDGEWKQIEVDLDVVVMNSIYPFIMSVCHSIHNDFVKCQLSKIYREVKIQVGANADNIEYIDNDDNGDLGGDEDLDADMPEIQEVDEKLITIKGLCKPPVVQVGDFVIIKTEFNAYLSVIKSISDDSISVDNSGLDIRATGELETVGILFVSFPPDFINAVLSMLGFDLFERNSKERRQERLGNYTYTNFDPTSYYGINAYPLNLQNKIMYWQKISV